MITGVASFMAIFKGNSTRYISVPGKIMADTHAVLNGLVISADYHEIINNYLVYPALCGFNYIYIHPPE